MLADGTVRAGMQQALSGRQPIDDDIHEAADAPPQENNPRQRQPGGLADQRFQRFQQLSHGDIVTVGGQQAAAA